MPSDRDAFLAAICAEPDDDTPRLAFADWLEEHDEADFAAFIRRQVELSRLPEWEPERLRAEYLDNRSTLGQLWHNTKWFNIAFPKGLSWKDERAGGAFRRGFPAALNVRDLAAFVSHAPELFRAAPIEELTIWGSAFSNAALDVQPLINNPWLARIRRLEFPLAQFDAEGLERLLQSPHAVNLTDLTVESLSPETSPAALFRSPLINQLERLVFGVPERHAADTLAAIRAVRGPHRLQSLRVTGRLLTEPDFYSAPLFENLTKLDLPHNPLAVTIDPLLRAPFLGRLESLRLHSGRLGSKTVPLVQSPNLTQLRVLDLSENNLNAKDAQALAESPALANLRVLNLEENPIGDTGAIALAKSPHLNNLLVVNLKYCRVDEAGVQALLDSPLCDTLVHLTLSLWSPNPAMKRKLRKKFGNRVNV